jgi:AcrR family transcriptional regulator
MKMPKSKKIPALGRSATSDAGAKHAPVPPRKRGRPLKTDDDSRRSDLVETSARLFREKGYEKTTVRDIAAAAGMQAGSWFYYFKTKQDILAAVMEQGMSRSLQDLEAIASQSLSPRVAFQQLVHVHLHTLLAPNHDFISVLLYEWRSLDQETRIRIIALKDRYEAIWDEVIEALHRSGDWAAPTRFDRLFMFGALNWTAQWFKAGSGLTIDALAEQAVQFILRTPRGTQDR